MTYSYDALGRRVARDVTSPGGSSRIEYLYGDPANAMRVTAVRSGSELTVLFYDESGSLYAFERAGARYYVASDHLGSPRLVSSSLGQVVKAVEYDAFGAVRSDTNPGFSLPIGFAGGLADPETGLVHFGYRDYEPASGRWTTRDPVLFGGGQFNLYAYVGNSPVTFRDPLGLWCFGASAYEGFGGGAKVCSDPEGLTICWEAGFGLGASVDIEPFAEGGDKSAIVGELAVGCGPFIVGVGVEFDLCGGPPKEQEPSLKCQFGPLDPCGKKLVVETLPDPDCKMGGKIVYTQCRRF
jgi:RHS repeat-associated protein